MSEQGDQFAQERQSLLSKLLDAVKQCQIRFGGRTELATENDSRVVCLCTQFENVLQHGIRRNAKGLHRLRHVTEVIKGLNLLNVDGDAVFWMFTRTVLNKHEYERYMLLKNIHSDIGRGRAWLRSALNERSLERYFHMMLADPSQISQFYEDWALMMDEERSSMLPMMAAGLGSILFAISIDNPDLNNYKALNQDSGAEITKCNVGSKTESFEPEPVVAKSSSCSGKKNKRKKWPTPQVISFDDNEVCQNCSGSDHSCECSSAPATCLSSPVTTNFSDLPTVQLQSADLGNIPFIGSTAGTAISEKANIPSQGSNSSSSSETASVLLNSSQLKNSHLSEPGRTVNASLPVPVIGCDALHSDSLDSGEKRSQILSSSTSSTTSFPPTLVDQSLSVHATLTPIDDSSVGELIPVGPAEDIPSSAEDSVSIPSFCDDIDSAAAALALAQRVPSWSVSSATSQGSRKSGECRSRSDTMTMNADELREAVLAVLQKKEEVEEKNRTLRSLLDREMEMSAGLRAEMEEMQKHSAEKMDKLEAKIQAVTRENELLKHQLRKYITAVQMLKHDSSRINELSAVVGDIQPAIPEPKVYIDHQFEASEYEKKLVQVAEMHGELMEFNDRLHRLLLQREATIRRLREELVDLRGPLPDDNQTSDDDVSITSDYDASSQTTPVRPLINVWIPSAFLTGRAADSHHVYQVYVRIRDDEWNIYRRYAQFYALHKMLKKKDPIIGTFDFPPKKAIGKKDAKVVEQRRRRLQHYLRCVLNWLLQNNSELGNSPDKETFISCMPFFGDQTPEQRRQAAGTSGSSRLCLPGMSSSPTNQQQPQPVQHYTGL